MSKPTGPYRQATPINFELGRADRWVIRGFAVIGTLLGVAAVWLHLQRTIAWRSTWDGARIFGDDCQYATGIWDEREGYAGALAETHALTAVSVPFRRGDAPPAVNPNGYLLVRCPVDLSGAPVPGWLCAGPVYGPTAAYLDQTLKTVQVEEGPLEVAVLPAERRAGSTLTLISRPDGEKRRVGPASLVPLAFTDVRATHDRITDARWFNLQQRPVFLGTIALTLFAFFALAWRRGIRYPDVGWILAHTAAVGLNAALTYFPAGVLAGPVDLLAPVVRYTEPLTLACFMFAFFRFSDRRFRLAGPFLAALAAVFLARVCVPREILDQISFTYTLRVVVNALILAAAAAAGLRLGPSLAEPRRSRVRGAAALAGVGSLLYLLEAAIGRATALSIEPFVTIAVTLAFGATLATDLVWFQRQYFREKARRVAEEQDKARLADRLELGRVVQGLLLPKEMTGQVGPHAYSFFYEPHQEMSGDWLASWEDGGRRHLVLGDVVGKGPQAALAVTAIMTALDEARRQSLPLRAAVRQVNTSLLSLFGGHAASTLTALSLAPDGSGEVHVSGSAGWHLWRGAACTTVGVRGSLLGVDPEPTIGTAPLVLAPGDTLFACTDGIVDGTRGTRRLQRALATAPPMGHRALFDLAVEMGRDTALDDDKGMIVVTSAGFVGGA